MLQKGVFCNIFRHFKNLAQIKSMSYLDGYLQKMVQYSKRIVTFKDLELYLLSISYTRN